MAKPLFRPTLEELLLEADLDCAARKDAARAHAALLIQAKQLADAWGPGGTWDTCTQERCANVDFAWGEGTVNGVLIALHVHSPEDEQKLAELLKHWELNQLKDFACFIHAGALMHPVRMDRDYHDRLERGLHLVIRVFNWSA